MSFYSVGEPAPAQIHYDVRPGLVPQNVFFIHGNLASNRWWEPVEGIFKKRSFGKNLKGSLIFAEFRGCGQSTFSGDEATLVMDRLADDFIELIKDQKLAPLHLVGHSTGGLIASLMMAKAPEMFLKAILLDPVGPRGVTFDQSMIGAFEAMKADRELTAKVIGSTIYQNNEASPYFQSIIVEDAFRAVQSVGHLVLRALDGLDIRTVIAHAPQPVLVLHGEFDTLLPMAHSKEMAKILPAGKFEMLEGCGHCANIEAPAVLVDRIEQFLF